MMRRAVRWIRLHPRRFAAIVVAALGIGANAVAAMHAWRFTHYAEGGSRTSRPEALSIWEKARVLLTGVRVPRPENETVPTVPYDVHRFGGLEAWRLPRGEARGTVLCFPGYGSSKEDLLPAAAAFDELGFETFLVDFHGVGGSDGRETSLGYHEADDVAAAVEFARSVLRPKKIVLYGESMGAAAVLRAVAVRGVNADELIVASPFDRLSSTVENRFHAMGAPAFPAAPMMLLWGSVFEGFRAFDHDPVEYARSVRIQTLMLHGSDDPRVTVEQARSVHDSLAGEKAWALFEGIGHESLAKARPAEWRRVVGDFLK